jgi:hypothetical protein
MAHAVLLLDKELLACSEFLCQLNKSTHTALVITSEAIQALLSLLKKYKSLDFIILVLLQQQ